mmetsp:Transcript_12138/g.18305  ORF Transcript_12138/g.18305 Transcript_12138/m.18305 type:complete len:184 (-) Transcript_12138:31-582(-)
MAAPKSNSANNDSSIRETKKYILFYHGWLSQFYQTQFVVNNVTYFCAEQYMMAEKSRVMGDNKTLDLILKATTPAQCKKLGRSITPWDEQKWDANKEQIVFRGNCAKFSQNIELKKKLLSFDESKIFVEAAANDSIWGVGLAMKDPKANNKENWKGLNLLGIALTKVRSQLLAESRQKNDPQK